ncbi:MAG: hypothetical protein DDT34_02211 [Firmicutes bacterium]|nr:hypothetical protein [Bacillota bacterium]
MYSNMINITTVEKLASLLEVDVDFHPITEHSLLSEMMDMSVLGMYLPSPTEEDKRIFGIGEKPTIVFPGFAEVWLTLDRENCPWLDSVAKEFSHELLTCFVLLHELGHAVDTKGWGHEDFLAAYRLDTRAAIDKMIELHPTWDPEDPTEEQCADYYRLLNQRSLEASADEFARRWFRFDVA